MARKAKTNTTSKAKKRDVTFEAITTITFEQELANDMLAEVTVKVYRDCTTVKDVPYQTENNCGAEVWGWGDKNWDSFTPETMPIKFKYGDERAKSAKGEVIWRCITAVYDPKTKKPLQMKLPDYKPWERNSHSISDMKKSARKGKATDSYIKSGYSSPRGTLKPKEPATDSLGLPAAPNRAKQMKKAIEKAVE